MPIQRINIGNAANDGTGDDLREAFIKVNANFQELDAIALQTGNNLGSSGATIFKDQVENIMNFRRIVQGTNIVITELDNTVVIDGTVPDQSYIITTDAGNITVGNGTSYAIYGGRGTTVSADNGASPIPEIIIESGLADDAAPQLSASLDANNQNITAVNNLSVTSTLSGTLQVTGDADITNLKPANIKVTGDTTVNYEENLGRYLGFDFGPITNIFTGQLQFLLGTTPIDLGTFASPSPGNIDGGSIL